VPQYLIFKERILIYKRTILGTKTMRMKTTIIIMRKKKRKIRKSN
jgi:hypothetical protein